MRAYYVNIVAQDSGGKEVTFVELVKYPERSEKISGCVSETEREAKAIAQVYERCPHLRNVKANGSRHI